ncbi:hypothetical protein [Leisingera caerulea]|uniref:hypothetical protein n=1 Tax=Leisingera caerulea TaxID=506591 RepID=UPI0021A83A90|nr:hypothetical protein [Leisingera caerulea]UWQ82079.1 hypothetical protein K3726_10150 [Leisingera caerulea]
MNPKEGISPEEKGFGFDNFLRSLLSFQPSWELLRGFGDTRFAKLSILVPVFGYLVLFNSAIAEAIVPSMHWACEAFTGSKCQPGSAGGVSDDFLLRRVVNIYVALSFFAVAALIFQALCPHEVKKFWHVESYVAEYTKVIHPEFIRNVYRVLKEEEPDKVKRILSRFYERRGENAARANEMYDRDMLALWFNRQNGRFSAARWLCFSLNLIGSVLLAYPTVLVFAEVISIVFGL